MTSALDLIGEWMLKAIVYHGSTITVELITNIPADVDGRSQCYMESDPSMERDYLGPI